MKLSRGKDKVLHLGRSNPRHQHMLGTTLLERSFAENVLGLLVYTKLNIVQQCALDAKKT